MAEDEDGNNIYFEVKDLSSEVLSEHPHGADPSLTSLTPKLPSEKRIWIIRKTNEAINKGANYLICRIPVWSSPGRPGLGVRWLCQLFPIEKRLGQREFKIRFKRSLPDFFNGIYLIKNIRHILIRP